MFKKFTINPLTNSKLAYFVLIVFLFAARLWHIHHFHHLYPDNCRQIQNAFHIATGKGNVFCVADSNDISKDVCISEFAFPVGYAFLLAKTQQLLAIDGLATDYLIEIGATIFLLFTLLSLIRILEYEQKYSFLLLFFLAISFTPFHHLTACEQITLSLYLWAICAILYPINDKLSLFVTAFMVGILIFACTIFRFAYYPFIATFPLFLGYKMLQNRKKESKKYFVIILISLLIYGITFVCLQQILAYNFPSETNPSAQKTAAIFAHKITFYWQNLSKIDGFVIQNLFYLSPIHNLLAQSSRLNIFAILLSRGAFGLSLFMLYPYMQSLWRHRKIQDASADFYRLGFVTGLVNIGMLFILSLFVAPMQAGILDNYTYMQETRYFAPTLFFVLFFMFSQLQTQAIYRYTVIVALVFAFLFTGYIFFQIHFLGKKELKGTYSYYHADLAENIALLKQEKAKYPAQRWVCATENNISERLFITIGLAVFEGNVSSYLQHHAIPANCAFVLTPQEIAKIAPYLLLNKKREVIAKGRFVLIRDI